MNLKAVALVGLIEEIVDWSTSKGSPCPWRGKEFLLVVKVCRFVGLGGSCG